MPHSHRRAGAALSAVLLAALALSGCTQAPPGPSSNDCAGIISKVLLTDDSGSKAATFSAADLPKVFDLPATPAPTCYYSSVVTPPGQSGSGYVETHRTLLYIGLSDSDDQAIIAAIRKTVSGKLWTVRFDYDTPAPTPTPGATATPTARPSTTTSARWYYNFAGAASDDKGQLGYYLSAPVSEGTAQQARLGKPVNVLRVETELRQVKK